jgi:hypothetical protein
MGVAVGSWRPIGRWRPEAGVPEKAVEIAAVRASGAWHGLCSATRNAGWTEAPRGARVRASAKTAPGAFAARGREALGCGHGRLAPSPTISEARQAGGAIFWDFVRAVSGARRGERLARQKDDPVSELEVARGAQLAKSTVSELMAALMGQGLVDIGPDAWGVSYRIWVTGKGERLVAKLRRDLLDVAGVLLASASPQGGDDFGVDRGQGELVDLRSRK